MYQPKVKGVYKHSDNHEEDIVCKGKLILIKTTLLDSKFKLGINEDF